jgi:regulatory protein
MARPELNPARPGRNGRGRAGPRVRKVDAAYLERAALHYLERFASSAANLRRVLLRKVHRSAEAHGTDPDEGRGLVDALVARFAASGLLDDAAYARARAATLHRRGASRQAIRGKLAAKGIDADMAAVALGEIAEDGAALDLAAACNFVRRRRLGCLARRGAPEERRDKDLAALGRAGFPLDVARRVLACRSADELDALAAGEAD